MKAYLINMHLLVQGQGHLQRSRSNIKVTFLKKWPFQGHSCFTNTSCFNLLLGTDSECNLRLVESIHMFIQRAFAAILACTFMKTLFTSSAAANQTLKAFILLKINLSLQYAVCLFKRFFLLYLPRGTRGCHFCAPALKDRGHIVLLLSVYPSICLSVCLHKHNVKTENVPLTPKLIELQGSCLV